MNPARRANRISIIKRPRPERTGPFRVGGGGLLAADELEDAEQNEEDHDTDHEALHIIPDVTSILEGGGNFGRDRGIDTGESHRHESRQDGERLGDDGDDGLPKGAKHSEECDEGVASFIHDDECRCGHRVSLRIAELITTTART